MEDASSLPSYRFGYLSSCGLWSCSSTFFFLLGQQRLQDFVGVGAPPRDNHNVTKMSGNNFCSIPKVSDRNPLFVECGSLYCFICVLLALFCLCICVFVCTLLVVGQRFLLFANYYCCCCCCYSLCKHCGEGCYIALPISDTETFLIYYIKRYRKIHYNEFSNIF